MNSNVTVVADATTNSVINQSTNNPEYGFVRLQQTRTQIDENGFLRRRSFSSLIHGPITLLQASNFYAGQILPGNIIVKEAMTPFNKKTPERDLKIAGETGIVCRVGGEPIYRKTYYSASASSVDITIEHDNVEELKIAYDLQASKGFAVKPNSDFDII
jgi:hypothetical protein